MVRAPTPWVVVPCASARKRKEKLFPFPNNVSKLNIQAKRVLKLSSPPDFQEGDEDPLVQWALQCVSSDEEESPQPDEDCSAEVGFSSCVLDQGVEATNAPGDSFKSLDEEHDQDGNDLASTQDSCVLVKGFLNDTQVSNTLKPTAHKLGVLNNVHYPKVHDPSGASQICEEKEISPPSSLIEEVGYQAFFEESVRLSSVSEYGFDLLKPRRESIPENQVENDAGTAFDPKCSNNSETKVFMEGGSHASHIAPNGHKGQAPIPQKAEPIHVGSVLFPLNSGAHTAHLLNPCATIADVSTEHENCNGTHAVDGVQDIKANQKVNVTLLEGPTDNQSCSHMGISDFPRIPGALPTPTRKLSNSFGNVHHVASFKQANEVHTSASPAAHASVLDLVAAPSHRGSNAKVLVGPGAGLEPYFNNGSIPVFGKEEISNVINPTPPQCYFHLGIKPLRANEEESTLDDQQVSHDGAQEDVHLDHQQVTLGRPRDLHCEAVGQKGGLPVYSDQAFVAPTSSHEPKGSFASLFATQDQSSNQFHGQRNVEECIQQNVSGNCQSLLLNTNPNCDFQHEGSLYNEIEAEQTKIGTCSKNLGVATHGQLQSKDQPRKSWAELLMPASQDIIGPNSNPDPNRQARSYNPGSPVSQEQFNLEFVDHGEKAANLVLKIPTDITNAGKEEWRATLVGRFLGKKLPYSLVSNVTERLWAKDGLIDTLATDSGYFFFTFSCEENRDAVMEGGPWFIAGQPLLLRPWKQHFSFGNEEVQTIPIWVNFYGVPLEYWNPRGISFISSFLGKPIRVDRTTASRRRITYARVCIEVTADFDFFNEFHIESEDEVNGDILRTKISLEYQWTPVRCKQCTQFGHDCSRVAKPVSRPTAYYPYKKNGKSDREWQVVEKKDKGKKTVDCGSHQTKDLAHSGTPLTRSNMFDTLTQLQEDSGTGPTCADSLTHVPIICPEASSSHRPDEIRGEVREDPSCHFSEDDAEDCEVDYSLGDMVSLEARGSPVSNRQKKKEAKMKFSGSRPKSRHRP